MKIIFVPAAWEEYLEWQGLDRKTLRRVNDLIREITRDPFSGIGKPEPLKHEFAGCWSRRIDREHRLVYRVEAEMVTILRCRHHY